MKRVGLVTEDYKVERFVELIDNFGYRFIQVAGPTAGHTTLGVDVPEHEMALFASKVQELNDKLRGH